MRAFVLTWVLALAALLPRPAHAVVVLGWHDVRDSIADGEPDTSATTARNLAMQFDWLRAHGYVPVSAQQVRDARDGRTSLPAKAVLLTFDGGWRSSYTQVLPLLRAYNYPALIALPTARVDASSTTLRDDGRDVPRDAFLTWPDVKAMQASGLVEFATQGHDLATPIAATPQGDLLPAAIARRWNGGYESDVEYRERLRRDLSTSTDLIERATGRRPQTVIWPPGGGNATARSIAASLGIPQMLDADGRSGSADLRLAGITQLDSDPAHLARLSMRDNAGAGDLAYELRRDLMLDGMRAVRVTLDDVVGADAASTSRNVDALVERMRTIRPTHVFVQPITQGADAAYFPNRALPVREDLLAHVAARLTARADVQVFAWLPASNIALADDLDTTSIRGIVVDGDAGETARWRPDLVAVRALASDDASIERIAGTANAYDFAVLTLPADATAIAVNHTVAMVRSIPGAIERTVFLIDTGDATRTMSPDALEALSRRVIAAGGRHVGYGRDVPPKNQPPAEPARAAISARAFPYEER